MKDLNSVYPIFKKLAFCLDAETAHELTISGMKLLGRILPAKEPSFFDGDSFTIKAMGLSFKGPLGLAAGLDKNAEALSFLTSLPFSFIEIGSVTPLAQEGNPKPRLWRYAEEESLRNCMGFNNLGADKVLENVLKSHFRNKVVGANLGKNKKTSNEDAYKDYAFLYEKFAPHVDYLVINVSSPNTPGLRDLLKDAGLRDIFQAVSEKRFLLPKPLLVKVSPDMTQSELSSVVNLVKEFKLSGVIATNTTIMPERGMGGVSGHLVFEKARATRHFLLDQLRETSDIELIGVGGFSKYEHLLDFWKHGGRLVQLYSSFVFQGPPMLYQWHKQLADDMKKAGTKDMKEFFESLKS
jgi:dihydroorotate dehydrogenase